MPDPEDSRHPARILTIPNILTILRLCAIPVVIVLLIRKIDGLAAALFIAASATDFLDGVIARRGRYPPTWIGQVLDPVADRLLLSSAAVVLAARGLLPGWIVVILVGRDVAALVGSLAFMGKIRVNQVGKAATATLMVSVVFVVAGFKNIGEIIFYGGFGLSIISGLMYARKIIRTPTHGGAR